jgi:hypothetical protein
LPPADAPQERDTLDLDDSSPANGGAIPVSIEGPSRETASSPATHAGLPRVVANPPQPQSILTAIQHAGLGMKHVVLLVLTMVFIAAAVSAAVTLYVGRGARPPAAETNQP